ncbi:TPA: extracellular solute-binding protein, partial [Candidatus Poribacteria bacterium]|nr:extracellular solute-binding protein [Candidatus Poribacteria bacterium]
CRSFKEAGIHPRVASGDGILDWFMNLLARTGGASFYNGLVQGTESWRDPRVIKAYEILRDLSKDYIYPHPFGFNSPMAWVRLNNCEAAMQLQGDWVNGMWQREYGYKPCKEYDYFLIPPIDPKIGQVAVVGGNAWIIPKNTPRRVHAKTFVEYAGSLEAHELMARNGMGILAHQNVPKKAYDKISTKLRDELDRGQTVPNAGAAFPLKVYSVIQVQNMKIVLNPSIGTEGIKNLTTEIEIVAREHHMLKSLNSLREYFSI